MDTIVHNAKAVVQDLSFGTMTIEPIVQTAAAVVRKAGFLEFRQKPGGGAGRDRLAPAES
jgi:hypothetical protein